MRKPAAISIIALLGVLATAAPAVGQEQPRQTYSAAFTTTEPGAPTGLRQEIHYVNPEDPDGKPYSVAEIVFVLPEGTRIDTSVPPQCKASDAELQVEGADACPPETKVGRGALSADTGAGAGPFPRVVESDVTFFNNQDELILFAETTNTPGPQPIRVASRIEVQGRTTISRVPPLPGAPPPDPFLAIKDVFNELDPISTGRGRDRRAYIATPPTCPESGQWTITATFTYRDGVKQTMRSDTPCTSRAALPPEDGDQEAGEDGDADQGTGDDGEEVTRPPAERFPRGGVETGTGSTAGSEAHTADLAAAAGAALTALIAAGIGMRRLIG